MSSHPGTGLNEAIDLACYLRVHRLNPEQVQDFYPTPGTLSTVMYYTGLDPRDMTPVFVARDPEDKAMQRALLQSGNPKNHALVRKALKLAGREDLIGWNRHCLVPPEKNAAPGVRERKGEKRPGPEKGGKKAEKSGKTPRKTEKPAQKPGKPSPRPGKQAVSRPKPGKRK